MSHQQTADKLCQYSPLAAAAQTRSTVVIYDCLKLFLMLWQRTDPLYQKLGAPADEIVLITLRRHCLNGNACEICK